MAIKETILCLTFNQDSSCFALGTTRGFRVFSCDPLKERFSREWEAGIGIVEMLLRCNILGLVGGGDNPKFPKNKLVIWDDYQNKVIAELDFRSRVVGVKLRRERIVVALENVVYTYNFADLQLLHEIKTCPNPFGLCAMSSRDLVVVASPAEAAGHVTVTKSLPDASATTTAAEALDINAHNGAISCLALSMDGRYLATASNKGTLVRVWDTATGNKLKEVRRGADSAEIYCINFNVDASLICVSSNKGTCHVFSLGNMSAGNGSTSPVGMPEGNAQSSLWSIRGILPSYFSSEWSLLHFKVPECRTVVSFYSAPSAITASGTAATAPQAGGTQANATAIVVSAEGLYSKMVLERDDKGAWQYRPNFEVILGPFMGNK